MNPAPHSYFLRLQQARPSKIVAVLLLVSSPLFSSGCGKKSPAKTSASFVAEVAPVVATTPVAGPPVAQRPPPDRTAQVMTTDGNMEVVLDKLSTELRRYVAYTRTIPKSFEEFSAKNPMQFPPAPAGKKYAIEAGKITLQSK